MMSAHRITLTLLTICLGMTACAWKIRSMSYDGVERMSKPADHPVPIIADRSSIDQPFVIIGLVEADPGNLATLGEREMLNAMKREARKMGGDALINLQRPLSNYSRLRTPQDIELTDRGRAPDHMPSYRWVAEVISYDILTEIRPDTLGQVHLPGPLRPGPGTLRQPGSP